MLHRHLAPRRTYVSGFFGGGGPSSTCTSKSPNAAPRAYRDGQVKHRSIQGPLSNIYKSSAATEAAQIHRSHGFQAHHG